MTRKAFIWRGKEGMVLRIPKSNTVTQDSSFLEWSVAWVGQLCVKDQKLSSHKITSIGHHFTVYHYICTKQENVHSVKHREDLNLSQEFFPSYYSEMW